MMKCGGALSRSDDRQGADEAAVAGYISEITAQLESMASAAGLDLLAYFLAMAHAEGEASARAGGSRAPEAPGPGDPTAGGGRTDHRPPSRNRLFRAWRSSAARRRPQR
jgi:hypothetical protein